MRQLNKLPVRVPTFICTSTLITIATLIICILATPSNSLAATPVDANLIPAGKEILNYFESIYGKRTLSAVWNNQQRLTDTVNSCSGKYPAIIGEDLSGWHEEKWSDLYNRNIQKAIDRLKVYWNEKGGIAQVNFHWGNPLTAGGTFPDSQEELTATQWNNITRAGTTEYQTMLSDLNKHLDFLQQLTDADIPVLWRPLHEIDGGWFWWTNQNDPAKTVELWKIVYNQMVNVRKMHNFIWVWSSTEINPIVYGTDYRKKFYPGDQYVDIIGVDLYHWDFSNTGTRDYWNGNVSYQNFFDIIQAVAPTKMVALCEGEALPNAEKSLNGDSNFAKWLYVLPWWASDCSWVKSTYAHEFYLTVDEIPNFRTGDGSTTVDPDPTGTDPSTPDQVETQVIPPPTNLRLLLN